VAVRHQDIDCAFYTASMALALIQTAIQHPDVIVYGSTEAVVSHMTGRMTDYFEAANCPKAPNAVREINIIRRWDTGREALLMLKTNV
jgi:predicted alpha/beta superfamily hydrolase